MTSTTTKGLVINDGIDCFRKGNELRQNLKIHGALLASCLCPASKGVMLFSF